MIDMKWISLFFILTGHFYVLDGQKDPLLCGNGSDAG